MDQTRTVPAEIDRPAPLETVQVLELETNSESSGDWITRLLSSGLFRNLPPAHSHRFFAELEPVSVRAGEVVVAQGDQGAYFYVITQGRCAVTRQVPSSNRELQLNVLRDGDTFGEAAILSGAPRTTTVRMLSNGVLMRLDRARFEQLVAAPMLSTVNYGEACRLVDEGALWLDVRQNDQRASDVFDGSLNVPGHVLSIEAAQLDDTKTYVVYCENGAHSATGAFLLTRLGFDAHVLDGGLARMRTADGQAGPAAADGEVTPPVACETAEPEPQEGDRSTVNGARTHEAPGDDEAAGLRAALETLTQERDRALAAASQAEAAATQVEERARIQGQHNAALMSLIGVQRDKHRATERKLESARNDLEHRIELERESFLRKLRSLRRELHEMRRDGARAVRQLEEERDAKANAVREVEARVAHVLETARFIENERSLLEQMLSQVDARLLHTSTELQETKDRLVESERALSNTRDRLEGVTERHIATRANLSASDARLSRAVDMLADANERLTTTTLQLVEANGKLSTAELRRSEVDGQLIETRSRLACALSGKAEAEAARRRAESALEVALDELRGQILELANLRNGLDSASATT